MRVLFVQYTNPGAYPPIAQAAHLLAEAGCDVRLLGVEMPETRSLRVPPHPRIRVQYVPWPGRGVRQRLHYLAFAARAVATTLRWRPRWAYVSDTLSAPIAALLGAVPGVRVAYHEHDVPLVRRPSLFMRVCLAARRLVGRRAAVAISANAERGRLLAGASARHAPVIAVWNCPRRADVRQRQRPSDGMLRVIYQGSIVPDRLPATLLDALAATPGVELTVVGYEADDGRGYVAKLGREAARLGMAERVRFVGPTDRSLLLDLTARYDLGLSLMPPVSPDASMQLMVGASNKVFEYLACGLPALVTDLPAWRATFVEPGYALACDPRDADTIARALRWAAEHRAELAAMGARGRARILDDWNFETQFAPVMDAIVGRGAVPNSVAAAPAAEPRSRTEVPA